MNNHFQLFGPAHLLILASVPAVALAFAKASGQSWKAARSIRFCLGGALAVNELIWYVYRLRTEGFRFPEGLPLQLCDVTLWLTVITLFTLSTFAFEAIYFTGLGGASMALITPDLWAPVASYPTVYFFVAHGLEVACILVLLWSRQVKPRPGFPWRIFFALNVYAAAVGLFNAIFHTNYMYLRAKPAGASIVDLLGPWPVYILWCEPLALVIFWLLWLPIRRISSHC